MYLKINNVKILMKINLLLLFYIIIGNVNSFTIPKISNVNSFTVPKIRKSIIGVKMLPDENSFDIHPSDIIKNINYGEFGKQWSYSELVNNIKNDHVEGLSFVDGRNYAVAIDNIHEEIVKPENIHAIKLIPDSYSSLLDMVNHYGINTDSMTITTWGDALAQLGSKGLNLFFFFVVSRVILSLFTGNSNNPLTRNPFINNKGANVVEEPIDVKFDDVAGCDEVKYELVEVVDFLKNPEKYKDVGAKVPKGVLLEGSPGTGKTLLAKAIAGEAEVPFISASGSEFIELFVGVGASRVRNLFDKAVELSPCVVFIDEIDAIGRQRGAGIAGGNDEREQTLNQILTNMDGFDSKDGIVVIAATNRADILDNALVRPGRFDRKINVPLPDKKGRKEIAKVHLRNKMIDDSVNLDELADLTSGFSGADIANLANEAAIFSVRKNNTSISRENMLDAFEKMTIGLQSNNQEVDNDIIDLVSYHETGHAFIASLFPDFFDVRKVTINANRGGAGGYTLFTPKDRFQKYATKKFILTNLIVAMGGRAAEIYLYNKRKCCNKFDNIIFEGFKDLDITTGASNDIMQSKRIARNYITQFGFSDNVGLYDDNSEDLPFLGREMASSTKMSELSKKDIDDEINNLINFALGSALKLIELYSDEFTKVVKVLKEERTISGDDIYKVIPRERLYLENNLEE